MEEEINFKYEEELKKIKNCIALNPGLPKYQVSLKTGVSIDVIRELIEEGILVEENAELKIARRQRLQNQERNELIQSLRVAVNTDTIIEKHTQGKSQLLIDLEEKRNGIDK